MKRITIIIALLVVGLFALAACSSGEATVSGNIVSQESVTLPDGATIQVQIQDVSVADAPAKVIGEQTIDGSSQSLPIPYEVSYDPSDIDDRFSYSMSVRIEDADGNLIYISDTNTPVITNGNPTENVDINVVPVGSPSTASVTGNIVSQENVTLPDGATIQVQIQDVSVADAPAKVMGEQTIDGSGKSLPIPYEVSYDPSDIDDRFSYSMSVRIEDGDGNLIYISDTNTPVITNGNPTENVNINVVPVAPTSSSGSIHNIEWQWRELSGGAVNPAQTIPDPENYTIIFREDGTFNGKADCNNISGTYTNEGGSFTISVGPSTMAACEPDSLDQEYLRLLSNVNTGGPSGPDLALATAGGAERMTFTNGGAAP